MLSGKNILRRRDILHFNGERCGAAGRHGVYNHAAFPGAQRFGKGVAAIFIAIADQQNAPRALGRKRAQCQLQRLFHICGHACFGIHAPRNADLIGLRGDGSKIGVFRKCDQPQFRTRIPADQIAQHGLTAIHRFQRHARRRIHQHGNCKSLDAHGRPRIGQRNRERCERGALERETRKGNPRRAPHPNPQDGQKHEQQ